MVRHKHAIGQCTQRFAKRSREVPAILDGSVRDEGTGGGASRTKLSWREYMDVKELGFPLENLRAFPFSDF